jgi:beta-glucosidase
VSPLLPFLFVARLASFEYAYHSAEPQPVGWPLTSEERAYILDKPEHERRPGGESKKYLPQLWPLVPSAGHWGGTSWLDAHAKLVAHVQSNSGPVDVLLVGDSITQQWGGPLEKNGFNQSWLAYFQNLKAINIGIGGDKTQNVLWRLDHGGVDGIYPRCIVLMVGNNNMFFTAETGVAAVAHGVRACIANLREKFPSAELIVVKILPCCAPASRFYQDIALTNLEMDKLNLEADSKVRVLDLFEEFLEADGKIKTALFKPDSIHLSLAGYDVYAARLKPMIESALKKE